MRCDATVWTCLCCLWISQCEVIVMTEDDDVQRARETTAERLERMARERRDRFDQQVHDSRGFKSWRGMSSGQRVGWVIGVLLVLMLIIGLFLR